MRFDIELWFFWLFLLVIVNWASKEAAHRRVRPCSVVILRRMVGLIAIIDMGSRVRVDLTRCANLSWRSGTHLDNREGGCL